MKPEDNNKEENIFKLISRANINNLDNATPNVIFIREGQRIEWTYEATKEMLKVYDEKSDKFNSSIPGTKKKLWTLISNDMIGKGFYYTGAQCENKWKTLKRNFRNKLGKIDKFGHKRCCPFENEITEILSKSPQKNWFKNCDYLPSEAVNRINDPEGNSGIREVSPANIKNFEMMQKFDSTNEDDLSKKNDSPIRIQSTTSKVVDGLAEIRKVLLKENEMNLDIFRQSSQLGEKVIQHLQAAKQRDCQIIELEENRIEQQNNVLEQIKIQNNLLQKLLEKIG